MKQHWMTLMICCLTATMMTYINHLNTSLLYHYCLGGTPSPEYLSRKLTGHSWLNKVYNICLNKTIIIHLICLKYLCIISLSQRNTLNHFKKISGTLRCPWIHDFSMSKNGLKSVKRVLLWDMTVATFNNNRFGLQTWITEHNN